MVQANNLTEWSLEEGPAARRLFLSPEIASVLRETENATFDFRELRNVIRSFLAGHFVTVSLTGAARTKADFKRLTGLNEIWTLCSRKPRSEQYRILGRFADKDIFVGLALFDRETLGNRNNYHMLAQTAETEWNRILPGRKPFAGRSVEAYFGGVYRNVDEF
jgi:hypothetical protein